MVVSKTAMWFPTEHKFKREHSISVPWLLFFWKRLVELSLGGGFVCRNHTEMHTYFESHCTEKASASFPNAVMCG